MRLCLHLLHAHHMTDLATDHTSLPNNKNTAIVSDNFTNSHFSGNAADSDPSASYDANGRPRRKRSKLDTTEPNPASAMTDNSSGNNANSNKVPAHEAAAQQLPWRRRRAGSNSGSVASSRRSRRGSHLQNHQQHPQTSSTEKSNRATQTPLTTGGAAGSPSSSPATGTMSKEPGKKKNSAVSRFLAFLNCCSSSSHESQRTGEGIDLSEKAEPAKVAVKPQPARDTQSLPNNSTAPANSDEINKQNAGAAASSAVHSMDKPDEKGSGKAQQISSHGVSMADESQRSRDASANVLALPASVGQNRGTSVQEQQHAVDNSIASSTVASQTSVLGPGQAVAGNSVGQQWSGSDDTLTGDNQHLQRQQQQQQLNSQNQSQIPPATGQIGNGEAIINDQTESQKRADADIEMNDAGPNIPISSRDDLHAAAANPSTGPGGIVYVNNDASATMDDQVQAKADQGYGPAATHSGAGVGGAAGTAAGLKLAAPSQQQPQAQAEADPTATATAEANGNAAMEVNNKNLDITSSTAIAVGAAGVGAAGVATGVGLATAVAAAPPSPGTSVAITPIETQKYLLPPIRPEFKGKKCLVLDLDETLVHSSFKVCTDRHMHTI